MTQRISGRENVAGVVVLFASGEPRAISITPTVHGGDGAARRVAGAVCGIVFGGPARTDPSGVAIVFRGGLCHQNVATGMRVIDLLAGFAVEDKKGALVI